jgi:UDP-N-acetylmuramate dehydrogenase
MISDKYNFQIENCEIYQNINLKKYTTYQLEIFGDIAIVQSLEALKSLVFNLKKMNYNYRVIGWGANQVILKSEGVLFIKLKFPVTLDMNMEHSLYDLPASFPLTNLVTHAKKFNLKNWQLLAGIPASLGGAIYMNAGTSLGEISTLLNSVTVLRNTGVIETIKKNELKFSYRKNHFIFDGDIIISAILEHQGSDPKVKEEIDYYLNLRKVSQPLTEKTCGCVFKNISQTTRAGQIIDMCGLKGFTEGNFQISHMHANFVVNKGNGNGEEFLVFIKKIQEIVFQKTGHSLELEVDVFPPIKIK